jgi:hypothetical protein
MEKGWRMKNRSETAIPGGETKGRLEGHCREERGKAE